MQKKFVRNLALVLFLNLLIKPFWIIGVETQVQNAVGVTNYGLYYAIFNFSMLLNILLDLGITNFNNRNIAQNNHMVSKHFASIAMLKFLLAGVYAVITIVVGTVIGYDFVMMKLLIMVVFNQVLLSFITYLRSNLAGLHLFKTDSIISVLDRLFMIVICEFLIITNRENFDILWFIYAQTAGYLLTTIITLVIVLDKARVRKLTWRWPFFLMILKKSYPFAVLVLLMTFYNRIDSVMLERMLRGEEGSHQSGIYAHAYRLLDASNMIAFLFAGLLLPMFSRMIKLRQRVDELVGLAFSLLVVPAIIVAVCLFFYSTEIMELLYHQDDIEASAAVFRILISCFVAISSTYIFGTLLTANGNLKQLNIMASAGMVINFVTNLILIPKIMSIGAATSSLVTQYLIAFSQVIMVQAIFKFHINYRFIIALVLFVPAVIGVNILMHRIPSNTLIAYMPENLKTVYWLPKMVLTILVCFGLAFAFRLIRVRNIYHTFRYGE